MLHKLTNGTYIIRSKMPNLVLILISPHQLCYTVTKMSYCISLTIFLDELMVPHLARCYLHLVDHHPWLSSHCRWMTS